MLRPISLDSTTSAVSLLDDALDVERARATQVEINMRGETRKVSALEAMGFECVKDPGVWRKYLPVKDGHSATEFVIGIIPAGDLCRIEDECRVGTSEPHQSELAWRCFLASVREIKGWPDPEPPTMRENNGRKYVDPVWLEKRFVGRLRKVALDIGFQAWSWNQLTETEIKN